MPASLPSRPVAFLVAVLACGCSTPAAPPPATPNAQAAPSAAASATPADADDVPPVMRDLDLTPAQKDEIRRIRADLIRNAAPIAHAAIDLGRSVAGAARQCKGESPFIDSDVDRVVRMGEDLRGDVIDAVQRYHKVLTPAQRKKLSVRLLEGDEWAKRERRNESRTRQLGPVLDLSVSQMMQMLMKARVLWTTFADRAEPWRLHYEAAVANFARDDFEAKREPVAGAPAVALMTDFLKMGLRFLIPLLEKQQCEALGRVIDEKLDEQAARQAKLEANAARERR